MRHTQCSDIVCAYKKQLSCLYLSCDTDLCSEASYRKCVQQARFSCWLGQLYQWVLSSHFRLEPLFKPAPTWGPCMVEHLILLNLPLSWTMWYFVMWRHHQVRPSPTAIYQARLMTVRYDHYVGQMLWHDFFAVVLQINILDPPPSIQFRGFFIQARLVADDSNVGGFLSGDGYRLSSCAPPTVSNPEI